MHDWNLHSEWIRDCAGRLWCKLSDGDDPTWLLAVYRQGRMGQLPAQLRKIVACLHLEGECGVGRLSRACHLPENVVSSQLQKLLAWGYVSRSVNQMNRRRSIYKVSDPVLDNALLLNYRPREWQPLNKEEVVGLLRVQSC